MAIRVEHELHHRRLSRNVGLGVVLLVFVVLVYGLTVAKLGGDPYDALSTISPATAPQSAPATAVNQ